MNRLEILFSDNTTYDLNIIIYEDIILLMNKIKYKPKRYTGIDKPVIKIEWIINEKDIIGHLIKIWNE